MLVVIVWNASGLVIDEANDKVRFLLMFVNSGKRVWGTTAELRALLVARAETSRNLEDASRSLLGDYSTNKLELDCLEWQCLLAYWCRAADL